MKKVTNILYIVYFSIMSLYYSAIIAAALYLYGNNEIDCYTAFASLFTCIMMLIFNVLPIIMILINRKWSYIILFITFAQFILGDIYAMIKHDSMIRGIINLIVCTVGLFIYFRCYHTLDSSNKVVHSDFKTNNVYYCRKCGAMLPIDSDFCTKCGERTDFHTTI